MKMTKLVLIFLLIFTLGSCASKRLPKPTGSDVGLLIVPTEGIRKVSGKFVYRYQFDFNDTDHVVVKVGNGKSFVAKILKEGNYGFNTMKTFGVSQGRTTATSRGISVYDLEENYEFEIKAGEVTYFPFGVNATIKSDGLHSFTQSPGFFNLTNEVLKEYNEIVSKAENSTLWQKL